MFGFTFGLWVDLYVCPLCQYHNFDYCSFVLFWNEQVRAFPLCPFFKIILAILVLWYFHKDFRISLVNFCKKVSWWVSSWILSADYIESVDQMYWNYYFDQIYILIKNKKNKVFILPSVITFFHTVLYRANFLTYIIFLLSGELLAWQVYWQDALNFC